MVHRRDSSAPRLLADIGGTNVRFALQISGEKPRRVNVYRSREYKSLTTALRSYLKGLKPGQRPLEAAFAVASPITGDIIDVTNSHWSFSIDRLRHTFGLARLEVINDFTALALAIPDLSPGDWRKIGRGKRVEGAPVAILGPGTGLGVSGLVQSPSGRIALQSEGGHVTLPAFDDFEAGVLRFFRRDWRHVSAERVLSGPGLVNLYRALAPVEGRPSERLSPATITRRALSGTCPACAHAVDMFCEMLGTVTSDLALSLGARGGVYLGGGVISKMGSAFKGRLFRRRFENKGRFSDYLRLIPTYLITRPLPAFLGLSYLLDRPTTE
ncbi:MAG: glucokinase [Gemmatimonadota bacterium]|nr:MAG: glucokinase [Gemmatimonadota bacterium]